jgi:DNA mismatch repair ATPase MutS
VARLAGLPPPVLANAREVLARLERYELEVFAEEEEMVEQKVSAVAAGNEETADSGTSTSSTQDVLDVAARRAGRKKAAAQSSLFDLANERVVSELRSLDPDKLSPDEAKDLLKKLRDRSM